MKKINYEFKDPIQGDPAIVYCNINKHLDWKATYTIKDIIESCVKINLKTIEMQNSLDKMRNAYV